MKGLLKTGAAILALTFCYGNLLAQAGNQNNSAAKPDLQKVRIIRSQKTAFDIERERWYSSLAFVRSIYNNASTGKKDTSIGTAFLLADNDKFYLVTAKNIITSTQYAKNAQQPIDTVAISFRYFDRVSQNRFNFKLGGLSGKGDKHPVVAFTDDEQNIAIISLQKKEFKAYADSMLAHKCKPVSIDEFDTNTNFESGAPMWSYGRHFLGNFESIGGGVCYVDSNDPRLPYFSIKKTMLTQGISGSVVVVNNKLAGVMTDATEASTRSQIGDHWVMIPSKVTKAATIIACLRKLQQVENSAGGSN